MSEQRDPIMQFFKYDHLPPEKQAHSKPFGELAEHIHANLPRNPERTVALRKLLEAKDAAVRAGFMVLMATLLVLPMSAFASAKEAPPFEFPGDVPAQVAPPPTIGARVLDLVTSPQGLGMIITAVIGALGGIVGVNEVRRRRLALATYHAFHIVEDLSRETENKVDDKIAEGLKALDAYLLAHGWRALKPGEVAIAKLGFQSLNGASALAEKVQTAALEAAVPTEPNALELGAAARAVDPRPQSP